MSDGILVFERQVLSLALIEKELYQLYTNLASKVEDLSAKALFHYIATDSIKHSTILAAIIDEVDGSKARETDCDLTIRHNKEVIKALAKDVAKTRSVNRDDLISLIDTLAGFENMLLAEYKKAFHLQYTSFSTREQEKGDDDFDLNIFTLIVGDEERHQKILACVLDLCDKQLSFKSNAPVVKYQRPDSWYVPPRRGSQ